VIFTINDANATAAHIVVVLTGGVLWQGAKAVYWKPEVAVRLVTDFSRFPRDYLPANVAAILGRCGCYSKWRT
jgi:hypothetical protein